jgi:hypothetical protein
MKLKKLEPHEDNREDPSYVTVRMSCFIEGDAEPCWCQHHTTASRYQTVDQLSVPMRRAQCVLKFMGCLTAQCRVND